MTPSLIIPRPQPRNRWPRRLAVAVLALILPSLAWTPIACAWYYHRGASQARADVAHGKYEIRAHGLPVSWIRETRALLESRYGVTYKNFGCVEIYPKAAFDDGYNQIVKEDLLRKFGRDIFEECAEEAEQSWRGSHR